MAAFTSIQKANTKCLSSTTQPILQASMVYSTRQVSFTFSRTSTGQALPGRSEKMSRSIAPTLASSSVTSHATCSAKHRHQVSGTQCHFVHEAWKANRAKRVQHVCLLCTHAFSSFLCASLRVRTRFYNACVCLSLRARVPLW